MFPKLAKSSIGICGMNMSARDSRREQKRRSKRKIWLCRNDLSLEEKRRETILHYGSVTFLCKICVWLKIKQEGQTAGFGTHVSTPQGNPFWGYPVFWLPQPYVEERPVFSMSSAGSPGRAPFSSCPQRIDLLTFWFSHFGNHF